MVSGVGDEGSEPSGDSLVCRPSVMNVQVTQLFLELLAMDNTPSVVCLFGALRAEGNYKVRSWNRNKTCKVPPIVEDSV